MKVKFIDTVTQETAWEYYPFYIYWWAEGNGACDCNRGAAFGHESDCGDKPYRYQAIDLMDHKDMTIEEQLLLVNKDMNPKYQLKTKEDILKAINEGLY